ncbi:glycosyltransferase family 39 protein [Pullulanibacillus sp. KACC 23026]|uniref:ArnT family glycosyltransferase n=1 Tax=Pullulanibacillus sp. KACC 23026 TaxID=3028315 RepID=UPI0023B0DD23|nr:glycosyltransferase family 39 protein [Pullulanibacillus sp. KACC 23026]WEG11219.1 glycosyltransferase family 39 protein [Pullulanibacillus sp. KACC 23026]
MLKSAEMNTTDPPEAKKTNERVRATAWEKPALIILLILTAVAYIWGLDQSGWSNSFYAAAVQAATKSWKAFFFGSIDASNFITVDKPPASLWVMAISARIFGLNSWSMLVPEAIEGVFTVWILYLTIRRWFSPGASLLAGLILAVTPVAAVMFRFNNPDALLVLLLTASAYFFTRSLEDGKTKWLVLASILIGFGFLTKMLAAFFVIPVFVVVYAVFAPVSVKKRLTQIIMSAISVVVSAGWWVAIVQLTPAADRPYIGSSQKNSILDLIFGYNGLGRLTGNESGNGSRMGGGGMFSGSTGIGRLFNSEMGGQISWLIPAALILLVLSFYLIRNNWRKNRAMPALLIWAGTFFVTGIVFSFGSGTIHSYYTVALAPALAAMIGISIDVIWPKRHTWVPRIGLALATFATAAWAFELLDRSPNWLPWLRPAILLVGGLSALGILAAPWLGQNLAKTATVGALVASLAGPLAFSIQAISTPQTGSTPSAGPAVTNGGMNGRMGGQFGGMQGGPPGFNSGNSNSSSSNQMPNFGGSDSGSSSSSKPPSGFGQSGSASSSNGNESRNWGSHSGSSSTANGFGNFQKGSGGMGGDTANSDIVSLLKNKASSYTWAAATVGSQTSATYQLASGLPIMDIGGFTGSDPDPTLAQFKKIVSEGKVHYFISGGMGASGGFGNWKTFNSKASSNENSSANSSDSTESNHGSTTDSNTSGNTSGSSYGHNTPGGNFQGSAMGGGFSTNQSITTWVENNFSSKTMNGVTIYDLTQPKSN